MVVAEVNGEKAVSVEVKIDSSGGVVPVEGETSSKVRLKGVGVSPRSRVGSTIDSVSSTREYRARNGRRMATSEANGVPCSFEARLAALHNP